jgi:predicted ribosomally synthesized peptide with SipW-like signal peptide
MPRPRRVRGLLALVALGLVLGSLGGVSYAAFSASTSTSATFSAASDWVAPDGSSVIAGTTAAIAGSISPSETYYVYAMLSDVGNPPSGISAVTADVSGVTAGQTAVALSPGSFSVGGISYNYRSVSVTADAGLTIGSTIPYALSVTDVNGNTGTLSGFGVTIVAGTPTGVDIQTVNGGATVGKPESGDQILYTYSEPMDPGSILSGWAGAATGVVVNFGNGCGSKQVTVTSGAATVALGTVCLGANYVNGNRTANATMAMSGSVVIVTLTQTPTQVNTVGTTTTMTWTPSATATNLSGTPCSTAAVTESGAADVEF